MNLGTAIQRADARGAVSQRNYLICMALENGSSYRDIARLLKRSVSTVWKYAPSVERGRNPLELPVSSFESERSAAAWASYLKQIGGSDV